MAEFVYNNTKNASTSHTLFELNYSYLSYISYIKNIDPQSKLKSAYNFLSKLRELMTVYSSMLKIFKNERIIKVQSQKVMPLMTKSGWKVNTSKPNKIESLKQNSLNYFMSFTR